MKTERLTLLVTPQEKALIAERAAGLGVSASEFVRRAVELFDGDDILALEELASLLPELNAMADRIETRVEEDRRRAAEFEEERAYLRSHAYRERLREEMLADERINWDAVRELFGAFGSTERAA